MHTLTQNLHKLLANSVLANIGSGLVTTFGMVFFYEKFNNSLTSVLVLFGALYLVFSLTAHFGARLIQIVGMRRMMLLATFFLVGASVVRATWETNPNLFLALFFLFFVLFKMLFWVPYHVEMTAFTRKGTRGKSVAMLDTVSEFFTAFLPFIAGLVVAYFSYSALFYLSTFFVLLSAIPLYFMHDTKEVYEWSFTQLVREFFKKENRSILVSNMGNGVEDAVGTVVWPIFIFTLLQDYVSVGLVSSFVMLTILVLTLIFGQLTDKMGIQASLKLGSALNFSGWVGKFFIEGLANIYFIDTYHKLGKRLNMIPFKAAIYDVGEYNRHYVDEYMVLRETAFLIGKCVMCFSAIALLQFVPLKFTFLIAAIAVLAMNVVYRKVLVT